MIIPAALSIVQGHHFGAGRAISDDGFVTRQQGEMFGTRLRNQHPVERIAMPPIRNATGLASAMASAGFDQIDRHRRCHCEGSEVIWGC